MIVAEDPGPEADLVIVGLLLTYGEFRSHQAYARRQYQCLTPDEVPCVGGARRTLGFPDFVFEVVEPPGPSWKNRTPRGMQTPENMPLVVSRQRRAEARARGDTGRSAGQRGRAKDNNDSWKVDSYSLVH